MNGHGFIYFWRRLSESGFIKVCSANSPVGNQSIMFVGEDVNDQNLSSELSNRNVNTAAACMSDGLNVRVRFRFDLNEKGDTIAVNVQRF